MNSQAVKTLLCIVALLAGCSDASENDFINALNLDDKKQICVSESNILGVKMWRDGVGGDQYLTYSLNKDISEEEVARLFSNLIENGYVDREPIKIKLYAYLEQQDAHKLTDKGLKHFVWEKKTCVGHRKATSIIEQSEPEEMSGVTFTKVNYTYDLELNELARDLNIEETIRDYDSGGDGIFERKAIFVMTDKGWRLEKGWRNSYF